MKMKKLVALATAAALCLGMSLTAFAADKSRETVPAGDGTANGGKLTAENIAEDPAYLKALEEHAMDWLKDNYPNIGKNAEVIAVGNYVLKGEGVVDGKVPGGKALFSFSLPSNVDTKGFKDGKEVYALHWNAEKKGYDIISGKLVWNDASGWSIEAEMKEFSPIAFIKVMSDGSIVEVDWKTDTIKTTSKKTSPKTGE